ncbi:MAG: hypothetical protein R2712_07275 [Vicinamibacterales bacterium]
MTDKTSIPPGKRHTSTDDRAQPGDVLGIERDGEVTELGDTREDEDKRREEALQEAAEQKRSN